MTRRAPIAALLALALTLAACRGGSPDQELRDAVTATLDTPIAFTVTARADRGALDELGDGAGSAAAFLADAGLRGARDADGRTQLALTLDGQVPLLEVVTDPDGLLLRSGLADLLPLGDADPAEQLGPALDAAGVSAAGRDALIASFAGEWIALSDVRDLGDLLARAGDDAGAAEAAPEAPQEVLDDPLDAVEVDAARTAGDVRRLEVVVATARLVAALGLGADVPERTSGTVVLRDGLVQELRLALDAAPEARDADGGADGDEPPGGVELLVTITPLEAPSVPRPDPAAQLTGAELFALVEQLQGATAPEAP